MTAIAIELIIFLNKTLHYCIVFNCIVKSIVHVFKDRVGWLA